MGSNSAGSIDGRAPAARASSRPSRGRLEPPAAKALLVEGSAIVAKLMARSISSMEGYSVEVVSSRDEAAQVLRSRAEELTAAVVDIDLDDGTSGEAVMELSVEAGVPTIALLGDYDDQMRKRMLDKDVVDYFIKGERGLAPLNEALHRLRVNPAVKILVADDSAGFRLLAKRHLEAHRFHVLEARDGQEAIEVFDDNPDVTLVITDYEMPRKDGIELVNALRDRQGRDELAIIGVSALGDRALPASYLKHGADDFLTKPFEKEEFYCRVYRSVTNVEQIQRIIRAAYTDALTGLGNRLHFFTRAPNIFDNAVSDGRHIAVAMADIDHFKQINDTYGHAGGDAALVHLAEILERSLPDVGVMARFGGEEFCALATGLDAQEAREAFERLRAAVESSEVVFEGQPIRFTLSLGVATSAASTLDGTINHADELLYEAKESGRNRVVMDPSAAAE